MGKKKKTSVFVLKPWCWYCERDFEDDKVLLQHQKSKHFKCQLCPRKLNTAGGLMVHSQQVHKCEPEPLTNTLPGRDGYDIEIFGMEGVPSNALAEWNARKETDAGTAASVAAAAGKRPRHSYNIIPEADLLMALAQHKALMASRDNPAPPSSMMFPPFAPPPMAQGALPFLPYPPSIGAYGMPPPGMLSSAPPVFSAPPFRPPFPPNAEATFAPAASFPSGGFGSPGPPTGYDPAGQPMFVPPPALPTVEVNFEEDEVVPPKDGLMWPDTTASPAEKRASQRRYRYSSPTLGLQDQGLERKRKAAADFI